MRSNRSMKRCILYGRMSDVKSLVSDFLFVSFLFIYIFLPYIMPVNSLHFLMIIPVYFLIISKRRNNYFSIMINKFSIYILFYFSSALFMVLIYIINGVTIPLSSFVYRYLSIAIEVIPLSVCFCFWAIKKGYSFDDLINIVLFVIFLEGIVSILMFSNGEVKDWMISFQLKNGLSSLEEDRWYFRNNGFALSIRFSMPFVMGFGAVLAYYKAVTKNIAFSLLIPVFLITGVINARICLVIFLVGIVAITILLGFQKSTTSKLRIVLVLFILTVFVLLLLTLAMRFFTDQTLYSWIVDGLLEISSLNKGETTGTFEALADMIFFPTGLQVLWGTGINPFGGFQDSNVPQSDIGYVIDLYQGGLILVFLLYLPLLLASINSMKQKGANKYIGFILLVSVIFANTKGNVINPNEILTTFFLFTLFPVVERCVINESIH